MSICRTLCCVVLVIACSGSSADNTGPAASAYAGTWEGTSFIACAASPGSQAVPRETRRRITLTPSGGGLLGSAQIMTTCTGAIGPSTSLPGVRIQGGALTVNFNSAEYFTGTASGDVLAGRLYTQVGPNLGWGDTPYTMTRVR